MTPSNGRYWLEKAAEICVEHSRTYGAINLSVTQEHRNRDYAAEHALFTAATALRALAALLPQETVPEGWKLVPERPTDVMVAIGKETWNTFDNYTVRAYKAYMAMVAAAPTPGKGE